MEEVVCVSSGDEMDLGDDIFEAYEEVSTLTTIEKRMQVLLRIRGPKGSGFTKLNFFLLIYYIDSQLKIQI